MQNSDFFSGSSIVPAKTAVPAPYPTNPFKTTMLLASADKNTKRAISKEVLSDQCRVLLAYSAMENVMMLSALEAHCSQTTPLSQERNKAIIDAYTLGAVEKIVRW